MQANNTTNTQQITVKQVDKMDSLVAQSVNINQLPVEVLLKVFSFIPQDELMMTVPQVCRRWEDLATDPSLFRTLELAKDYPDTATAIRYLSTSTWLTSLELSGRTDTDDLIQHIGVNHPCLVKLVLDDCRGTKDKMDLSEVYLQQLLRRCTRLQHLSFLETLTDSRSFSTEIGLNLPNLRGIKITSDYIDSEALTSITNNCNHIQKILSLQKVLILNFVFNIVPAKVVANFCDKFNESLVSVVIENTFWTNASLASVTKCRNVKELDLRLSGEVTDEGLMSLCQLQKLESLTIAGYSNSTSSGWVRLFENPSMKSLVKLCLTFVTVDDPVAMAISLLPNITDLRICEHLMTDDGLLALSNIPNLVRLTIKYSCTITSQGWIRYFQTSNAKKITHLRLISCDNVTDEVAQIISQNLQQLHN